jgi:hypothetical protein
MQVSQHLCLWEILLINFHQFIKGLLFMNCDNFSITFDSTFWPSSSTWCYGKLYFAFLQIFKQPKKEES